MGLSRRQIGGICASCALLFLALAAVYRLRSAKVGARRAASAAKLHSWGLAILFYREMKGEYPGSLQTLIDVGIVDDCPSLVDPFDEAAAAPAAGPSYAYVGAISKDTPQWTIIAYSREGMVPGERLVLWNDPDPSVDWVSEADLHAPEGRVSLGKSYEAVAAAFGEILTHERDAELRQFYEIED